MQSCSANSDGKELKEAKNISSTIPTGTDSRKVPYGAFLTFFGQDDPLPRFVADQIRRLDTSRDENREISGLHDRVRELEGKYLNEAALQETLQLLGEGLAGQDLEEQKCLIQALVGSVMC